MDTHFRDTETTLGVALQRTISTIQGDKITLQQLLRLIGEQGLLFFCTILTIPFLLPVSIPGVSTIFGLVIILIGVSVTLSRTLWLPNRLRHHQIDCVQLIAVLEKGVQLFTKLERWMGVRLPHLTRGAIINRINGALLTAGGVLLLFPLSFVPFSNTLPALAVLLLALGTLERDGYFVLAGYLALVVTMLYFGGLALLVVLSGQSFLG